MPISTSNLTDLTKVGSSTENNDLKSIKLESSGNNTPNLLPLELVIGLNQSSSDNNASQQDEFITKNILEFFNLSLSNEANNSRSNSGWLKTKKIVDALNFIRFSSAPTIPASNSSSLTLSPFSSSSPTSSRNSDRSDRLLSSSSSASSQQNDAKISLPCFSLVLLTNSPSTCRPLVDKESGLNGDSGSNNWYYHYKIELNDDRGKPIARQVRSNKFLIYSKYLFISNFV